MTLFWIWLGGACLLAALLGFETKGDPGRFYPVMLACLFWPIYLAGFLGSVIGDRIDR